MKVNQKDHPDPSAQFSSDNKIKNESMQLKSGYVCTSSEGGSSLPRTSDTKLLGPHKEGQLHAERYHFESNGEVDHRSNNTVRYTENMDDPSRFFHVLHDVQRGSNTASLVSKGKGRTDNRCIKIANQEPLGGKTKRVRMGRHKLNPSNQKQIKAMVKSTIDHTTPSAIQRT